MKRRPWRFKGLPFYKHPIFSPALISALMFAVVIIICAWFPGVPDKVKLALIMICIGVSSWILWPGLRVLENWYEANKAERAKNEALFLQQQKDEDRCKNS